MAQSGFSPIQLYRSATLSAVPTAGNLVFGELALNYRDGNLFFKDSSNVVRLLASTAAATGTVSSVQASGGTTGLTFTGGPITTSGTLTLGGTLAVANGGTGVTTSTGTGSVVRNTSPTLVTPTLGAASATSIAAALGAVGTPSYTFTGDTNTGMWSPAADTIAFSEGGVEAMRIDSSGNVGIGTSSPSAKLDVAGNLRFSAASPVIELNNGGPQVYTTAANTLQFATGGGIGTPTERMRIDSSGNVGIGVTTPESNLDLAGAQVTRCDVNGYAYFAPKLGTTPFGANYDRFEIRVETGAQVTSMGNVHGGTGSPRALAFLAGGSERMRIDSSGNVGIGTSSPSALLDVNGAARANSLTLTTDLAIADGGTGASTASAARTNLGATTVGGNLFTLTDPSAITFLRLNADNTVTARTAADFRSDIGAGTVTSVAASGGTTGLTFTGSPITASGTLTLGGTLAVANGGTGATAAPAARTNLGATTVGGNIFTLTNPSAITFLRLNADNTVSALNAADFRTAIGAGTGTGTVTSVSGTGTVNGITLTGTVTTSGSLTLGGTLSGVNLTTQVTGTLPVANGGTGTATAFTLGSVVFAGASGTYSQDNANFFWDDTNNRLGVGTSTPAHVVDARGTIRAGTGTQQVDLVHDGVNGSLFSSTALLLYAGGANSLILHTNGSQRLRINSTGGITSSDLADAVGYKGLPQNSQTTGYTLVLADQGKHISITTGGVTIPANGTTAFPVGTTIVVFNNSASTQAIGITTDTLRLAGTTTTGTRTLAAYGLCTLVKVGTTTWVATGNVT